MLNSLLPQTQTVDVEALRSLLFLFVGQWKSAPTEEARSAIEGQAIQLIQTLINGDVVLPKVTAGTHPLVSDWMGLLNSQEAWTKSALGQIVKLAELYLRFYNEQKTNELQILGLIRRIKQKQAVVKLWGSEDIGYLTAESFLNLEGIKSGNLTVDTGQGVALLPIRKTTEVSISALTIGTGSNGFTGNSDATVTRDTKQLTNCIDSNQDNWFEYERLDRGPLLLNLVIKLDREQPINHLAIKVISQGFVVDDCLIGTDSKNSVSVKTLTADWHGAVTKIDQDMIWQINFLPTMARQITLKLVANSYQSISVSTSDGRIVPRDRYSIGLQQISVSRIEFESQGILEGRGMDIPKTMLAAEATGQVYPAFPFHTIDMEWSSDQQTWQPFEQTLLLNQNPVLYWRMQVKRLDDVFKKQTSFSPNFLSEEVESTLRSVSKLQSPARLSLAGKIPTGTPTCFQPKLLRRGNDREALDLCTGIGADLSFPLPLKTIEYGVELDQLRIFVNGLEWDRVDTVADLGVGYWTYTDDLEGIQFDSALTAGSKVKVLLEPEALVLNEGHDGYYAELDLPFDPDPTLISVVTTPRDAVRKNFLLPRGLKVINLQTKNLLTDEFTLTSRDGTAYSEVTNRDLLAANTYYVDYKHGLLYLNDSIVDDQVRVAFKHRERKEVKPIRIWYRDGTPAGVVLPRTLQLINGSDTIGDSVQERINRRGHPETPTDFFSSSANAKQLAHKNVVQGTVQLNGMFSDTSIEPREIQWIDGHSEFLGLTPIIDEETQETAETASKVAFTLSAGALVWLETGVSFSDATVFATLVGSVGAVNGTGKYYIAPTTGLVTVWVGPGGVLEGGIKITYLFRDIQFNPTNTFSVDYARGVLYGGSSLLPTGVVTYKAADVLCSYDVAVPVPSVYDGRTNTVEVKTELLNPQNNLVKTIWVKNSGLPSLESLAQFYSPLITKLEFRFH